MSGPTHDRISLAATRVAGAVLCCAGALKIVGGQDRAVLPGLAPPWVTAALPALELLLGVWLVSGVFRFGAYLIALVTFSLFSLVALSQVQSGASDCGCFGSAVTVSPWLTLTLDVTLVFALLRFRPRWAGRPALAPVTSLVLRSAAVAGLVLAAGAAFSVWRYGSVMAGVAAAAGMPVAVTTPVIDVSRVAAGELTDGTVEVINLTGSEEQVAYVSMRCHCAVFDDLPVALPPGQATRIGFRLLVPAEAGAFRRPAVLQSSAGDVRFEMIGVAVASR